MVKWFAKNHSWQIAEAEFQTQIRLQTHCLLSNILTLCVMAIARVVGTFTNF